jgi:Ca2+-binding EF-hand superfamily protein
MKQYRKEQIEEAFSKADKDSSGKLSIKELQSALLELIEDDDDLKNKGYVEMLMSCVDRNGDKTITCEEFIKLMNQEMDHELMLKNMVKNADTDGDGLLSAGELKTMMMKIDPEDGDDESFVNMVIRMCAHDTSKKIKPKEFLSFMIDGPKEKDPKEDAKRMFQMFDTDKDGYISKKELATYFKDMMADDDDDDDFIKMTSKMMLASADEDEDGKLNLEEFTKMMDE